MHVVLVTAKSRPAISEVSTEAALLSFQSNSKFPTPSVVPTLTVQQINEKSKTL